MKIYFDKEQHLILKETLFNLNEIENHLLFREQGNKLTDSFKKIIENGFISGWLKADLIEWIVRNFKYLNKNQPAIYKKKTVEQTISADKNTPPCKRPIIEVVNGKIQKKDY